VCSWIGEAKSTHPSPLGPGVLPMLPLLLQLNLPFSEIYFGFLRHPSISLIDAFGS
jgi:hypothetical protein